MTTGGSWRQACEFGGMAEPTRFARSRLPVPVTMSTTPVPTAGRRMSARRLHRGQMRAEDPPFLVLHLDTDAAPAVYCPHDDAAPRRSDARADGLEAHTVAALELVGQCFRSYEAQGTWC